MNNNWEMRPMGRNISIVDENGSVLLSVTQNGEEGKFPFFICSLANEFDFIRDKLRDICSDILTTRLENNMTTKKIDEICMDVIKDF